MQHVTWNPNVDAVLATEETAMEIVEETAEVVVMESIIIMRADADVDIVINREINPRLPICYE